jgi:hypothetical protein
MDSDPKTAPKAARAVAQPIVASLTRAVLDFSRAITGNLFFAPSATFLDAATKD